MKKSYLLIAAALGCVLAVPVGFSLLKDTPPASAHGLNTVETSAGEASDTPADGLVPPAAPLTPVVPAAVTQGDAEEAVNLIVRHLPPNCGPAIQGTGEDLSAG